MNDEVGHKLNVESEESERRNGGNYCRCPLVELEGMQRSREGFFMDGGDVHICRQTETVDK